MQKLRVRVRLVVNLHQLPDGSVRIFLRGGERLVAEQLLNGAKISAIREQMRGESVAQRMRVQVPVDVNQPDVFLDDASHRSLRQALARIIQKNSLHLRVFPSILRVRLFKELFELG